MKCPTCLSTMTNRDERHHVEPDSYRMNLHCNNFDHEKKAYRTMGCLPCHMGVIVPPSYANQEWICDHYNFRLQNGSKWYILRATPSTPEIGLYNGVWRLKYGPWKYTELLEDFQSQPIIRIPFIPISTNNDMHEQAWKLFRRLTTLRVFS